MINGIEQSFFARLVNGLGEFGSRQLKLVSNNVGCSGSAQRRAANNVLGQ